MRSAPQVSTEVDTTYPTNCRDFAGAVTTLPTVMRRPLTGSGEFPLCRIPDAPTHLPCSYDYIVLLSFSIPSDKVGKVVTKRISMDDTNTSEVATLCDDLVTRGKVVTGFPCVKCDAETGSALDLLCPLCYAEKRPPRCPACGGRLAGGKCGWC